MNTHDIKRYAISGDIAYPIHEDPEGDYVTYEDHVAAIEADRQRRKPQHIDPELKAAIEDAAKTRSPVAITKDGRGVMLNYGDQGDRMAEHEAYACPYCGGSGHKDDVADRKRRGEPVGELDPTFPAGNSNMLGGVYKLGFFSGQGILVYTAPQPAEPVIRNSRNTAEPVKVPSDAEVLKIAIDSGLAFRDSTGEVLCAWREDADISEYLVENARALLARYGNQTQGQP